MIEHTFVTEYGIIHYWFNAKSTHNTPQLVFLPGLTADHRLFNKQIECFEHTYPVLVWDAPGHGASRPFDLEFSLKDKADWLKDILEKEQFTCPLIIGQSMGGYVAQAFAQYYPERIKGFLSIDSAPLQKQFVTNLEILMLKHMEPVYRLWPWENLLKLGTTGVAVTPYGQDLMRSMMQSYTDQKEYAKLCGHGYRILAEAMEMDLPYALPCPTFLICGREDHAGSCIRYNKAWHKKTGLPLFWIDHAGHNSNTDQPEEIDRILRELITLI